VVTVSAFEMDSEEFTEIGRKRSNSLSSLNNKKKGLKEENTMFLEHIVEKQISVITDLKNKIEKENLVKSKLTSQNELLTQQLEKVQKGNIPNSRNEELIHEFIESLKCLNIHSDRSNTVENHKEYEFINKRLLIYKKIPNSNAYERFTTPTSVYEVADNWNDINEIRYANDISISGMKNPKVILYRNSYVNSCSIIIRIKNKQAVIYGVNGRNIEIGCNSFSVYEVEDIGSFTDNISRLIYVDYSGLYFVPRAENSVESIINAYQKEGRFSFKGSIIKVSTFDGSITLNNNPITENNFFDNWIKEEREVRVSNEPGKTIIEKEVKTALSDKHPQAKEILRNFYPPDGQYENIYKVINEINSVNLNKFIDTNECASQYPTNNQTANLRGRNWLNYFINKRLQATKEMSSEECENLIRDHMFGEMLKCYSYNQRFYDVIADKVRERGNTVRYINENNINEMIYRHSKLFNDPDFVRSLKPGFAEIEKDYPKTRECDIWLPFEIVKNL